jgi:hypothetical protein
MKNILHFKMPSFLSYYLGCALSLCARENPKESMTNNKEVTEQQYLVALTELELATKNYELALTLGLFPVAKLAAMEREIQAQRRNIKRMSESLNLSSISE